MTHEYLYRNDYTNKLQAIPDDCFRARRWLGNKDSYPHALLRAQLDQLNDVQAIYRMCFWTTPDLAVEDRKNYERGESISFRCLKSELATAGFNESWDDGLGQKAYLFWTTEPLDDSNLEFSKASIPFSQFEVLVDGDWVPFAEHISPPTQATPSHRVVDEAKKPGLLARIFGGVKSK